MGQLEQAALQGKVGRVLASVAFTLGLGSSMLAGAPAEAQDTRTVTEPVIPVACTVLAAQQAITAGEPTSETLLDTARIQAALTAAATNCAPGTSVELTASGANNAFLTGPITIPAGILLVVDGGVTVFGSRNPADYQSSSTGAETCGTVGTAGNGCNSLIAATGANSGIMGYGIIDGRGQDKLLVNGVPATYSWWDQAGTAQNVSGAQNNPILVTANAANLILYKITLRNSPMFHVKWSGNTTTKTGFTAWGVKVITPFTARNSDGIDPSGGNITITNSSLSDGDDMVAVSAASPSQNITVQNTNTYSGHGISVGSYTQGGLSNMLVQNITQMGTAADGNQGGLRLKTAQDRGGLVQNVTYQNVCSANNKNAIYISPYYNTNAGTSYPTFSNITYRNVHIITESGITLTGYANTGGTVIKPTTLNFDNFVVDTLKQTDFSPTPAYLTINLGPGPVSPLLQTQTGNGVSYTGGVTNPTQAPYPCNQATFQYLVGELYGAAGGATNLHNANVTTNGSVTLNAMLQPAMSQVSYASISGQGSYTGTSAISAPVQFLEGTNVVGTASLAGNGTLASVTLSGLTAGTHTYTAFYAGDSTYTVPLTFGSFTVTVGQANATTTSLTATPATVTYGSATVLAAAVAGAASGTPGGQVVFVDGGTTPLATVAVASAAAQTTQVLGVGSHSVKAVYSGDMTYAGSSSAAATVIVTQGKPSVTLAATPISLAYGSNLTLTATLAPAGTGSYPTGAITFYDGATAVASTTVNGAGLASAVVTPGGGNHSYTASYAGDSNYTVASSAAVSVATALATTTTVETVTGSSALGSTLTFSAAIAAGTSATPMNPSGTVTFLDGTTMIGSATVSGRMATATAVLGAGAHSLTAQYSGDQNFAASTSAVTSVSTVAPLAVTATPQTLSLSSGGSSSVAVSVTPAAGVAGTVTLSCASPVSYISCSITPASQTLNGTAAVAGTLTVKVAASVAQLMPMPGRAGQIVLALLLPLGVFGALRRRTALRSLLAASVLLGVFGALSGCAATPSVSNLPPAGTQAITVTAISGNAIGTTVVNVSVTP